MSGKARRPRSRVLRLRAWLLASVVVFAGLLIAFITYTHYRARRAFLNLPHQLGIDIKSQTDGFTISRVVQGRTLFTIHAARAIQHNNGITILRDVAVTLYGPPGSNRTDSIRGGEFEYDQNNGVVRAMGDTLLDVGIEEGREAFAHAKRLTMHSRGLVFLQKLGVASTREQIQFQYGASQGEAVGADYELDTGTLTLQHDVHLHSMENGHAEQIDAASAQLDRNTRVATLQDATLKDAADTMHAPRVVALLRSAPDDHAGTLRRVDASGGVTLQAASGERVRAPELHADLTTGNRLAEVNMRGGVQLIDGQASASAQTALLRFANGQAEHLFLTGNAHLQQTVPAVGSRTLDAAQIDSALQRGEHSQLSFGEMHASGGTKLVTLQPAKQPGRIERTELVAPTLIAHAASGTKDVQIRRVEAMQGAHLLQQDGDGGTSTSDSQTLVALFADAGGASGAAQLESLIQQGHVTIRQSKPAADSAAGAATPSAAATRSPTHTDASADRAEFQSSTNLLVLTGSPRVQSDSLQLAATRISLNRDSGDAEAAGAVRGSVSQSGSSTGTPTPHSSEPTRFAAEAARLTHSSGSILLQGGAGDARLWSDSGQVEAPSIQVDGRANTLHAYGPAKTASGLDKTVPGLGPVKTVLQQQSNGSAPSRDLLSPTRIVSRELLYRAGPARTSTADFTGGIRLLQGDDVILADNATALLQTAPAASSPNSHAGATLGDLQSITASGHVRVQQGARAATGSRLVYTAATRNAVLTGSSGSPPVARDPVQGILTGTELVLHMGSSRGDNQVEVKGAPTMPVHTELDVPDSESGPASQTHAPAHRKSRRSQ